MRGLSKMVLVGSADYPYGEIDLRGNTYLDGYNGAGKSSALRAVLYFYIADGGSPALNEKGSFKDFYYPYVGSSYILYECEGPSGPFTVVTYRRGVDIRFIFADTPYRRDMVVGSDGVPLRPDAVKKLLASWGVDHTPDVNPDTFKKILWGSGERELRSYRKFSIARAARSEEMIRIIQNSFLMNKIEGEEIKRILTTVDPRQGSATINLAQLRDSFESAMRNEAAIRRWFTDPADYPSRLSKALDDLVDIDRGEATLPQRRDRTRAAYFAAREALAGQDAKLQGDKASRDAVAGEIEAIERRREAALASIDEAVGEAKGAARAVLAEMRSGELLRHNQESDRIAAAERSLAEEQRFRLRDHEELRKILDKAIADTEKEDAQYREDVRERLKERKDKAAALLEVQDRLKAYEAATIGFLDKNVKGWRDTIGKVIDEDLLYSEHLSPSYKGPGDGVYGLRLDLAQIGSYDRSEQTLLDEARRLREEIAAVDEKNEQQRTRALQKCMQIRDKAVSKALAIRPDFSIERWNRETVEAWLSARRKELESDLETRGTAIRADRDAEERLHKANLGDLDAAAQALALGRTSGDPRLDAAIAECTGKVDALKARRETLVREYKGQLEPLYQQRSMLERMIANHDIQMRDLAQDVAEVESDDDKLLTAQVASTDDYAVRPDDLRELFSDYKRRRDGIEARKRDVSRTVGDIRREFSDVDLFSMDRLDPVEAAPGAYDPVLRSHRTYLANLSEVLGAGTTEVIRSTIDHIYAHIITTVSDYAGNFLKMKDDVRDLVRRINRELASNTYVKAIKKLELRQVDKTNALVQKILEIQAFCNDNNFSPADLGVFNSEASYEALTAAAKKLVEEIGALLCGEFKDTPALSLSELFDIKFDVTENGNVHLGERSINRIGSDGTDKMAKILINLSILSALMQGADRRDGPWRLHCAIDETGQIDDDNLVGLIQFANSKRIEILNASPKITDTRPYSHLYRVWRDDGNQVHISENLHRLEAAPGPDSSAPELFSESDPLFLSDDDF